MSSKKRRGGLDVDDVIGDFWKSALPIFNRKYGVEASKSDFTAYDSLTRIYGIDYDEFYRTIIDEGVFEKIRPYPGAVRAIQEISDQGVELVMITSRGFHPQARAITEAFFHAEGIPFDELHIKTSGTKADYLSQPVDFFVDDLPKNLADLVEAEKVKHPILMTQLWNAFSREPYLRIQCLSHMPRLLEDRSRSHSFNALSMT